MTSHDSRYAYMDPRIHRLSIKDRFESLYHNERLYAHHLCKAVWAGTRIILHQTSPESEKIFDFIMAVNKHRGDRTWNELAAECSLSTERMQSFTSYAGMFLSNVGNRYGEGGQRFIPQLPAENINKLLHVIDSKELKDVVSAMANPLPRRLGHPDLRPNSGQKASTYYMGTAIAKEEISEVDALLVKEDISPNYQATQKYGR